VIQRGAWTLKRPAVIVKARLALGQAADKDQEAGR
jgi:hypothetical protein